MPPTLKLNAVAFISPQNQPILIRTFVKQDEHAIKYHYIAHTSLDVIEERVAAAGKSPECYLGLLFALEDVAVYGYITPLKVKIVIALPLSDSVVRDAEVTMIFKALHMAYYSSISNPFLKLHYSMDGSTEQSPLLVVGSHKWKNFRRRVDEISWIVGQTPPSS
ncbi:Trafficking protein particle complex subunit 2-like protein [Psilocybe cubensis]|uniref:Trafficking protein particle complex subunit 2-like protein n=2 Tax=Psilocybe cubensis TaxID=181762 RepID=A0A8H7Y1W8_PSICU|nr:Trafficking protein particle complex subunit 2-like protein [Psilocybe cubensis]KAH9483053.1 Trafficking protein particle complex subunit 2-like protein [Psilocybe cubensis]